jgi:hypothetical protein
VSVGGVTTGGGGASGGLMGTITAPAAPAGIPAVVGASSSGGGVGCWALAEADTAVTTIATKAAARLPELLRSVRIS